MILLARSPRVVLLGLAIVGIFALFTARLWRLQFVRGEEFAAQADRQRLNTVRTSAPRGLIYDVTGKPLVRNEPNFDVAVVPAYLPEQPLERDEVLIRLATMLDMPYTSAGREGEAGDTPVVGVADPLQDIAFAGYYDPIVVATGVERERALLVAQEALLLPGVTVQVNRRREYPHGPLVSQLLGYLLPIPGEYEEAYVEEGYDPATDRVGVAGVEATQEDQLRGTKGERIIEEDVVGRQIRVVDERTQPVPGNNVYLTIDLELQAFVDEMLREGMAHPRADSPRGAAIVMRPATGEVLAMVSLPTYDNRIFVRGTPPRELQRELEALYADRHRPLINHAIADELPPGSVFKIVTASGALQSGVVAPERQFECRGTMEVPNKYFPNDPGRAQPFYCWNRGGHGWLDMVGGIAHSCDIYFYKVGGGFEEEEFDGLGVAGIAEYSQLFGLGERTGIELPGEAGGLVPTADWKRLTYGETWSTGDTYNLAIGQGYVLATPLQMLNAVNVVANDGALYRPRIVHHVTDFRGETLLPFEPELASTLPISAGVWDIVQAGMEGAVAYGTAPNAQIEGMRVAGKTGTAQFCDDIALDIGICGVGLEQPTHAWFAAYAPVEVPEVSVIVFLYNGGEGSVASAPIAHAILEHYFGLDEVDEAEPGGEGAAGEAGT